MKLNKNQAGFSAVEAILILAVLGLVGFIGWRIYDANQADNTETTTTQQSTATPIEKAEDLDKTTTELNSEDIDAQLDTSEIDAALAE